MATSGYERRGPVLLVGYKQKTYKETSLPDFDCVSCSGSSYPQSWEWRLCLKQEMVQLESSEREIQESSDRCTAIALLVVADMQHSTLSLHADHTTTPTEEAYHQSANSSISLPESQTTTVYHLQPHLSSQRRPI
ncbi:hypothetical protein J6590_078840 [Homalodisca vitripennis]|nr:hypothetical protein J6590_078840 [Homalodisca vitripennis]